jgi:DNA-binding CsgD family transcriptional regulator
MLSIRERQVLQLVALGLSNRLVAREMGLGEETVRTHLKRIYARLGVNRAGAVARGIREGWIYWTSLAMAAVARICF